MGGRGYANRDAVRCALVLELRTLRRQRRASSELKGEGAGSALTCMEITDLSQYYHRLSINAPKCPKCYIISLAGVTAQIVRCIVVSASRNTSSFSVPNLYYCVRGDRRLLLRDSMVPRCMLLSTPFLIFFAGRINPVRSKTSFRCASFRDLI